MQFLGRFFRGLWRFLDGLRKVLHLLLLLALFAVVVAALRESIPRLPEKGALVIHPSGEIVEQLATVPLERALTEASEQREPQTLLWDLTEAIRVAADDPRIQALLIETDDMGGVGQVKLEELGRAIAAFRAKGKKVIARGSYYLQGQYYLAAQADEVYVDPFGFVLLDGYERYSISASA
jgi:protease-4